MLKNGISKALVDGIPTYIDAPDIPVIDNDLLRVVEIVPKKKPAFYSDDKWDFSECFKYTRDARCIIDFSHSLPEARQALKNYALDRLEAGDKVTTVSSNIVYISGFLKKITIQTKTPFVLLTDEIVIKYIKDQDCKYCTKTALASLMYRLFKIMNDTREPHLVDVDAVRKYYNKVHETAKHEEKAHFMKVPDGYMDQLVTMLDRIMRDDSKPYDQRMTAGMMLIDTQMGMRISEIPIMPHDCIRWAETTHGKMPYIVYRSQKAARYSREVIEVEHMGTQLLFDTLKYYLELRKRSSHADEDFLYVDESTETYPISKNMLQRRYRYLVKQYMPEAKKYIEGIRTVQFRGSKDTWYIPSIHCLRTTVFSAMANHGVPYPFIEKMMSHTPGSMCDDSYYTGVNTPENTVWEELDD